MSKQSDDVKSWRKRFKERIIVSMGGGCCICGYNKCQSSLALHHLDPAKKDFGFGSIRANPKNWQTIVEELRKCILICHNCHFEVHEGVTQAPDNAPAFDEKFCDYRLMEYQNTLTACPICGTMKRPFLKHCSLSCSGKSKYKVDWDNVDLVEELKTKSVVKLAEELGCSDGAIHKRLKKLGLK
jgi:hypothetical protein